MSKTLSDRQRFGSRLGLERIQQLCEALGHPEQKVPVVHIAGTNGKGSTAAFLAAILQEAGLRVGLYTSPHLVSYRERFQINGLWIDQDALDEVVAAVEQAAVTIEAAGSQWGPFTEFEVGTAAAFRYFADAGVEIAVIETGLGGRFDATNVVRPLVSVITPIGYDHMDWLGDTLPAIAAEKAGIIKPSVPVVVGVQHPTVIPVLRDAAQAMHAPIALLEQSPWQPLGWDFQGGRFSYAAWSESSFAISMLGGYQLANAGLAVLAAENLRAQGWPLTEEHVRTGLKAARWPGRLEIVSQEHPWMLLDGAHNPQGVEALAQALETLAADFRGELTFVFGMLENKAPTMIDPLLPLAREFLITQPASSRIPPYPPERLAAYVESKGVPAAWYFGADQAMAEASTRERVVVCGSLYLLGEIRQQWDAAECG